MKRLIKIVLLLGLVGIILSCNLPGGNMAETEAPAPTETQTPAPSATATAIPENTATVKPKNTATSKPKPTEPAAEEPPASGESNFEYIVSGCREAIISGSVVEDNSIPIMYSLILLDDSDNALLLYLPIELGDEYFEMVVPYDVDSPTWPTASLFLDPDTFEAQEGMMYVYSESDGSISGNMEFNGVDADDAGCEIYVMLNFDHLPLPEM